MEKKLLDFPGCFEYRRPCINSSQVELSREGVEHRRPGYGRGRVSTPEQNAALVAEAVRHPFQSASAIRTNSQFPESIRTAIRRLKDKQLFAHIVAKKELLKYEHKLFRLAFSEENTNRNWSRVIFSDEVTFSSTNGGKMIVYCPRGARYGKRYVAKQIRRVNNKAAGLDDIFNKHTKLAMCMYATYTYHRTDEPMLENRKHLKPVENINNKGAPKATPSHQENSQTVSEKLLLPKKMSKKEKDPNLLKRQKTRNQVLMYLHFTKPSITPNHQIANVLSYPAG
ncbi:hypothetical protein C0J52_12762 [Blattella germanica]|nr:hypothetical protein C0J52_12762 [Blattella germanica]